MAGEGERGSASYRYDAHIVELPIPDLRRKKVSEISKPELLASLLGILESGVDSDTLFERAVSMNIVELRESSDRLGRRYTQDDDEYISGLIWIDGLEQKSRDLWWPVELGGTRISTQKAGGRFYEADLHFNSLTGLPTVDQAFAYQAKSLLLFDIKRFATNPPSKLRVVKSLDQVGYAVPDVYTTVTGVRMARMLHEDLQIPISFIGAGRDNFEVFPGWKVLMDREKEEMVNVKLYIEPHMFTNFPPLVDQVISANGRRKIDFDVEERLLRLFSLLSVSCDYRSTDVKLYGEWLTLLSGVRS